MEPFALDFETLSLTDIIRLQNQLSGILARRFERHAALVFSDIVESTTYFARFGDEAGHRLQQQHFDMLGESIGGTEGKIVDTVGDGALLCFSRVEEAVHSLLRFKQLLRRSSFELSPAQQWSTRIGVHWGTVLTDSHLVAGDAVNLCAKIASTADPEQVRLSKSAFHEMSSTCRLACQAIGSVQLPSTSHFLEMMELLWKDLLMIPSTLYIEETGTSIPFPDQPVVTFGRLATVNGARANDIILELPDPHFTHQISRWHFEILRESEGLALHALSNNLTEVDGRPIRKGERAPISIGSQVRVANVLTLKFLTQSSPSAASDTTISHWSPASRLLPPSL